MFFETVEEIKGIAEKNGCSVFVMPDTIEFALNKAILLKPEERSSITIEQVREVMVRMGMKQVEQQFVVIRPAGLLGEEAANALLKNLEEPKSAVHFILITDSLTKILPTILSRSAVYFLRDKGVVDGDVLADEKTKMLAKKLIVAKSDDLVQIADEITQKKEGARQRALEVLAVALEILYKSYFKTGKVVFVDKIPKFLLAYDNIGKGGHIKLHLIADLL